MAMANDTYRFQIGKFQCTAVSDGTLTYAPPTFPPPAALLFANAPKEELEETLREHKLQPEQWVEWISSYICLVVDTPECRVLVDTGADGLAPTTGKLQENLKAEGISSEEIVAIQTTLVEIRMLMASQLFLTPASSYGKTSGISGLQDRQTSNSMST
jgi:hypothetical protein